ncbi:PP2C family protein-serine/threonine phosphatase [Effusibacillus dendaii]|uniref:PPM-type phosphatase domain-containing protein n=1 Tax=Effusibacillus dendaii TaxID=2743772 RepID=A0A7I8D6M7_9BACL|nr:PP2C family protein-serine/threonine phosphatase [Effusibacillus dendaii]BCJ85022.1 hypothetical protein skT53_00070 [Effusibacillus dendaii]
MRTNELNYQFEKYISNVQNAAEEVLAAQTIQQMLLYDNVPECSALSCIGISIPAYRLSGDYYDFIYDELNGKYWVFIGDVMGKGIPASLMMVMLRTAVRCLVRISDKPSELLSKLNNILYKDLSRLRAFSTLFCGMFDIKSGELIYSSAGHPSPVLMRQDRRAAERLGGKGTVIGILKDRKYNDFSCQLTGGDLIIFCTDGILEAMDSEKKQYGYERLLKVIAKNKFQDPGSLIQIITNDVKRYSDDFRRDDVTLVAVRFERKEAVSC